VNRPAAPPNRPGAVRAFALAVALGSALAYKLALQPWTRSWGATIVERTRTLPGDEAVAEAGIQITRAVTIAAPLERVCAQLAAARRDPDGCGEDPATFLAEPLGGDSARLISRLRVAAGLPSLAFELRGELPHFLRQRRALLKIKARAEGAASGP
jgi:hypothetical protein